MRKLDVILDYQQQQNGNLLRHLDSQFLLIRVVGGLRGTLTEGHTL